MKNRKFLAGFAGGFLCCLFVTGLGLQVVGANRNITINDDIKVRINETAFVPRDANGRAVPVFSYEGTTYAPIRALCEAAGMQVSYDSATRTAHVTIPAGSVPTPTPTPAPTPTPNPTPRAMITEDEARKAALDHAGKKASEVTFLRVELDRQDNKYEVEFYIGNVEYDYEIDAYTGAVLSWDYDIEDFTTPSTPQPTPSGPVTLLSQGRAKQQALSHAPAKTKVIKCELDWDHGKAIYEIEMVTKTGKIECELDAETGEILKWEIDD